MTNTQTLLAVTGVAVFGIGLAHLILGGAADIGGAPLNATAQGERRFFAALFACYGLAFPWCVPAVEKRTRQIISWPLRLVGGLARLLSIAMSGPPNAFYTAVLLAVELALPVILFFLSSRLPQSS